MAREISDPRRVHLVHMEILFGNGLSSTQRSTALIAPEREANKNCEDGNKERFVSFYTKPLQFKDCDQMKSELPLNSVGSGLQTAACDNLMRAISESVVFAQSC